MRVVVYLVVFLTVLLSQNGQRFVNSEPLQDKQALLSFLSQVPHARRLNWNQDQSVCTWVGIVCDATNSSVYSLRLPGMNLIGPILPGTLGRLYQLRVLSLRSNRLSGSIPSDFSNLTHLRCLYLQNNQFSSEFPPSVTQLARLTRLDLSSNNFTGSIPSSVNNLTRLTGLFLQNNGFNGNLPNVNLTTLVDFNVANNNLSGSIPAALSNFPAASFTGNSDLCGDPLPPCNISPAPSPSEPALHKKSRKKLSTLAIVFIAIGAVLAAICLLLILLCLCRNRRKREPKQPKPSVPVEAAIGASSSKDDITGGSSIELPERNKLVFVANKAYTFDLEDLLRASAEVLGKGSVGTSYKAVLEDGTTVVVKRLKDVVVGKKEFETVMEGLGRVKHENVLPLLAFYYSRDEKLLVTDYLPTGSLSSLLHGGRGTGKTPLDWDNRMRTALTAVRGLAYLHVSGKIVHGDIKSSNVLLRSDYTACLSDFGLNPLFNIVAPSTRVAGYRAPEVMETRKVSYKSDIYSFGVLLLELLTGKSPNQASLGEEGIDLPRWVQSVVREEWTAEVFDVELLRNHHRNIEEEMVEMLQIAMACVSTMPDQRPSIEELVKMIEDVHNRGAEGTTTDDGIRQSSDDPSKGSDGQTPPQESRTPLTFVTP